MAVCTNCEHPTEQHSDTPRGCSGRESVLHDHCGCQWYFGRTSDGQTIAAFPPPGPSTPKGSAKDSQVGGDHYQKHSIQPWDIWQEYGLNAFEGAVLKYLLRRKGDRLEDLRKARHTLDRLIEIEEGKQPNGSQEG